MIVNHSFTWRSSARTDTGCVRAINEDAFLDRPDIGLWVVADGMGGHEAGDVASRLIVDTLAQVRAHARMSAFVNDVEARLLEVNERLLDLSYEAGVDVTMGSTVVALLISGSHSLCLWAGDSRAYLYRDGQLHPITRDHSHVEELVEKGLLLRVDAERHPEANVITRAVGVARNLYLDLELRELRGQDRYLLCSDGLCKEASEPEMAGMLAAGTCDEASQGLVRLALEHGGPDNVTVVVVQVENGR